eukprot:GHVP01063665.1.p1 GENE.GHVP01063665.1~~GHVP01063665.1.p1  ORF type:complete len:929 (+),score=196.13 GHVP01063665.1:223-2787(+)
MTIEGDFLVAAVSSRKICFLVNGVAQGEPREINYDIVDIELSSGKESRLAVLTSACLFVYYIEQKEEGFQLSFSSQKKLYCAFNSLKWRPGSSNDILLCKNDIVSFYSLKPSKTILDYTPAGLEDAQFTADGNALFLYTEQTLYTDMKKAKAQQILPVYTFSFDIFFFIFTNTHLVLVKKHKSSELVFYEIGLYKQLAFIVPLPSGLSICEEDKIKYNLKNDTLAILHSGFRMTIMSDLSKYDGKTTLDVFSISNLEGMLVDIAEPQVLNKGETKHVSIYGLKDTSAVVEYVFDAPIAAFDDPQIKGISVFKSPAGPLVRNSSPEVSKKESKSVIEAEERLNGENELSDDDFDKEYKKEKDRQTLELLMKRESTKHPENDESTPKEEEYNSPPKTRECYESKKDEIRDEVKEGGRDEKKEEIKEEITEQVNGSDSEEIKTPEEEIEDSIHEEDTDENHQESNIYNSPQKESLEDEDLNVYKSMAPEEIPNWPSFDMSELAELIDKKIEDALERQYVTMVKVVEKVIEEKVSELKKETKLNNERMKKSINVQHDLVKMTSGFSNRISTFENKTNKALSSIIGKIDAHIDVDMSNNTGLDNKIIMLEKIMGKMEVCIMNKIEKTESSIFRPVQNISNKLGNLESANQKNYALISAKLDNLESISKKVTTISENMSKMEEGFDDVRKRVDDLTKNSEKIVSRLKSSNPSVSDYLEQIQKEFDNGNFFDGMTLIIKLNNKEIYTWLYENVQGSHILESGGANTEMLFSLLESIASLIKDSESPESMVEWTYEILQQVDPDSIGEKIDVVKKVYCAIVPLGEKIDSKSLLHRDIRAVVKILVLLVKQSGKRLESAAAHK